MRFTGENETKRREVPAIHNSCGAEDSSPARTRNRSFERLRSSSAKGTGSGGQLL